jgi:TRAP transporter T-component
MESPLIRLSRRLSLLSLLLLMPVLSGCAGMVTSATGRLADNLSNAILNQDDPETVKSGAPAYLLLIDSLIDGDPQNENLLLSGSKLYGAYASAFVQDPERTKRLARKARDYSDRALCVRGAALCNLMDRPFDEFTAAIGKLTTDDVPLLYASGAAWAGWIQANSGDWNAIANLAKVKALMMRVVQLDETYDHGRAHLYLGVFDTLLPPAMGGKPEEGRAQFERAIELSGGRDLMDKVEFARRYARVTYNRELHDRLLNEVIDAKAAEPGLTLSNVLAQQQARELLKSADSYF